MRAAALIVMALAASPVEAKPWQCVMWPKTCQLDRAPGDVEPLLERAPAVPAAPAAIPEHVAPVAPSIAVPVPVPRAAPVVKKSPASQKRVKSNWVKPKKKKVALPSWCWRIPAGTTMDRIDSVAPVFVGRALTPGERTQARACLESKRTS